MGIPSLSVTSCCSCKLLIVDEFSCLYRYDRRPDPCEHPKSSDITVYLYHWIGWYLSDQNVLIVQPCKMGVDHGQQKSNLLGMAGKTGPIHL